MITLHYLQDIDMCKLIRQKLERAYEQLMCSLTDQSILPYCPTLYPIPFMVVKKYRVGYYLTKVMFYSLTYPDAKDFNKFAIYINATLIEKFPHHLCGLLGHEIAHIIDSKGKVEMTKENLALILKDRLNYLKAKEKSAADVYHCFAEPIQSKIKDWNIQSTRKDIEYSVLTYSQLVNQEEFDNIIFGDRYEDYKEFIKFNLNRLNGKEI